MIPSSGWFPDLDSAISEKDILSFPTKKSALEAARSFGWNKVMQIERRFENVWIVGRVSFQPDIEVDIEFTVALVPLLRWEQKNNGTKFCPVIKFRKPKIK